MVKWKAKRFLALALAGVLLSGSLSPAEVRAAAVTEGTSSEETVGESAATADETEEASTKSEPETAGETAGEETVTEGTVEGESTETGTEEGAAEGESVEAGTEEGATEGESVEAGTEEGATKEESTEQETEEETTEEETTEAETESTEELPEISVSGEAVTREIKDNLLKNFDTDFEGLDGEGKLYWWSDASWGHTNVAQKTYDGMTKPTENSGNAYMEVTPNESGQSVAQICAPDIAALLEPEATYEFSYFAKLEEGTDAGTVSLEILSASTDWSSVKGAEITYDSEVVLDAAEWKQVSGTFKIPAHASHDQVKVAFNGSDNLTFCIDDFMVGGGEKADITYGDNLVKNPNFAESDLSVWGNAQGSASITAETADNAIFDEVKTYGVIADRTSSQECFAQDMTDVLKAGSSYEYSFWVMLDAEDYKDAPAEQREVCFAPYVSVDGTSTYWGSYSTGVLDSGCIRQIDAGEWTQFSGTFKPQFEGEADALVIRILEQGTNYGSGDCVKGKYYVTGVSIREKTEPKKEIEWDIPNLKDIVSSEDGLGTDCYTATSIMLSEISDSTLMDLVEKHFNAVTFGNELKMDALFDYHDGNNSAPGFETVTWTRADGTVMTDYKVPVLNYTRAEKMLDAIKEWNDAHPEDFIKVRGHVLVWHSQAPEWFFHEDWDKDKPYVSAEVMDARQEWYIKTVLEHFFGESSPYKDMFYGWDVVNEAVSDGTGTYRNAEENSSWWRVYNSPDYIVNAFRYANKYIPANVELYYNDYNECVTSKVGGIAKLLTEVKSHETDAVLPTRITGMGMQGHHQMTSPTAKQIKDAAVTYGNIVGKVQITELDIKASNEFDGTEATLASEYTKQAYRYKEIYEVLKEVDAMDGIDVNGLTVWGVIDGNSWLQTSNSVGGASDGSKKQVPLLFDDDYKAKPAFYAFVNADKLEPYTQSIVVMQAGQGDDAYANSKEYAIAGADASFKAVWEANQLKIKVTVQDAQADTTDGVTLYLDWAKAMSEGAAVEKKTVMRTEAQAIEGGYTAEFTVEKELAVADSFAFDIVVTNGETKAAFNDLKMTQESSSKYFAVAMTKPYMSVSGGTVVVDAEEDELWQQAEEVPLTIKSGTPAAEAAAKVLWDEDYLYVWMQVKDAVLDKSSSAVHEQDSVEVFIDENNHKSDAYEADDKQYRINFENEPSFNGENCKAENVISKTKLTEDGYVVEAAFKWTEITPAEGKEIGLELQINDGAGGTRIGTASWYDESGQGWSSPSVFGTVVLGEKKTVEVPEKEGLWIQAIPDQTYTGSAIKPTVAVWDGNKLLKEKKDYKVSYKKNVNAGTAEVKVTGIGNYKETDTAQFQILPKNLEDEDITAADVYSVLSKSGTVKKPAVTVKYGKKKLSAKDMEIVYPDVNGTDGKPAVGNYTITIKAKENGNYTGSKTIAYRVLSNETVLMSKVKVALSASKVVCKGEETEKPTIQVTYGSGSKKTTLEEGVHYTVDYVNYDKAGKASVAVKAIPGGGYYGSKTVTYTVTGTAIGSRQIEISGIEDKYTFTGSEIQIDTLCVKDTARTEEGAEGGYTLVKDTDYKVVYSKNINAGKATVVIQGIGAYTGKVTKKFTIQKADLTACQFESAESAVYTKNGAVPNYTLSYQGRELEVKKDFTVSFSQNKAVVNGQKTATMTVKGKGNFEGSCTAKYEVTAPAADTLYAVAADVSIPSKASKLKASFKVYEEATGKALKAGTDYEKKVSCYIAEDGKERAVTDADLTADKVIGVRITLKNNYAKDAEKPQTVETTFRLYKVKASTFKVERIPNQVYTGREIEPDVVVKNKAGEVLTKGVDYKVTYSKNVNKGTAKVMITGIGNGYGGTKTVSFKITAAKMNWAEEAMQSIRNFFSDLF